MQDVVITGHDRAWLGALVFLNGVVCRELQADEIRACLERVFEQLARDATGSSTRVARALIMEAPPSIDAGEITDKGSINQRAVLKSRAAWWNGSMRSRPIRASLWLRHENT